MKHGKSLGSFEFRTLQVFVTTAEQGGMTRGAEVLGMTQSGVSQTIAALEEAVGRQLFDRTVRPIVLTGAGRALLERGKKILADVQQAYFEAAEIEKAQLANISITMPESLANVLGPRLYHRAGAMARSWRISNALFPDQLSRFNAHAADIMITEESHVSGMIGVERYTVFTEPYVLIFPKDFPLETELGPHLSASKFIRFSLRSSVGRKTEAQLNRLQLKFPEQVEFDSVTGHARAVSLGDGWGITTPLCLAQTPDVFDDLVVKPISRGSFYRRMSLVAREGILGKATETVTEECRAILSEDVIPSLVERLPWLEEFMSVGEP
ncbi:LysR family transcriptional regulator [Paraurantiacibacter namhicola]|uniref:HTH-type transcriptional regulator CynR n=1 Tax=Paraurantiacibacter namhicola TaxID=645517 RepID=A0A1C7D4P4_9SPHN|nr:LysR family transcriptional regulator [Paraurantiacibacter namhicola]ANU06446.1 HTH-type transcriptional regulator CynR [Paraurantiacibacter namhicola]